MTWPFDNEKPASKDPANAEAPKPGEPPKEKPIADVLAESLRPFADSFTKINERLDGFERQLPKRQNPDERPPEVLSVLDDENAAFAQRLTPLALRQLEIEARLVKSDIRTEYARAGYGDLWDQYEVEINKVLDASPVVTAQGAPLRGDPEYVRNTVDMVFGREARKAGMQFGGKGKGFFLESGSNGSDAAGKPQDDGLTEGQRRVFGRMHVGLDDAKKVMGKLKFV